MHIDYILNIRKLYEKRETNKNYLLLKSIESTYFRKVDNDQLLQQVEESVSSRMSESFSANREDETD